MNLALTFSELPALFTLFSPLWFLLFFVSSGLMIWNLDKNRGGLATITAVLTIAAMVALGEQEFPGWVYNHPKHFLAIVGSYFVVGAGWGVVKWYLFASKRRSKYDDSRSAWLRNKIATTSSDPFPDTAADKDIPQNLKPEWKQFLEQERDPSGKLEWCVTIKEPVKDEDKSRYAREDSFWSPKKYVEKPVLRVKPFAREHKAQIVSYMTFWPWSLAWALLDDIVHHAFRFIQQYLSDWMDRIATRVFHGVEKDFSSDSTDKTKTGENLPVCSSNKPCAPIETSLEKV